MSLMISYLLSMATDSAELCRKWINSYQTDGLHDTTFVRQIKAKTGSYFLRYLSCYKTENQLIFDYIKMNYKLGEQRNCLIVSFTALLTCLIFQQ